MSALEVESSVRYCEHLLFVQRSQRHTLSTLSQQFKQLQALCQVLTSFKDGSLAPQVSIITSSCNAHDCILLNTQNPLSKVLNGRQLTVVHSPDECTPLCLVGAVLVPQPDASAKHFAVFGVKQLGSEANTGHTGHVNM